MGEFVRDLPFEMTEAQGRAAKEVGARMAGRRPIHRLLQGDVGSGKTVVALDAAMAAVKSGHQATIMAPTEVLAAHTWTAHALLDPLGARNVPEASVGGAALARKVLGDQTFLFRTAAGRPGDGSAGGAREARRRPAAIRFGLLSASVTGKARERVLAGMSGGDGSKWNPGRYASARPGRGPVRRPVLR